jgi:uncharacterized cupin superfamily protein
MSGLTDGDGSAKNSAPTEPGAATAPGSGAPGSASGVRRVVGVRRKADHEKADRPMASRPFTPVVNVGELETGFGFKRGDKFSARLVRIGAMIGAKELGCMLTVVEPGKRAWPFHAHHSVEEMFIVLQGTGEYRLGDKRYPIKAGDVMSAPAGGPESAHQIINTGAGQLSYLAISTMNQPDVIEHPDSGKVFILSRMDEGLDPATAKLRLGVRYSETVGFWDGEDDGKKAVPGQPEKT